MNFSSLRLWFKLKFKILQNFELTRLYYIPSKLTSYAMKIKWVKILTEICIHKALNEITI
jgi:hypothetical protein